jgi:glycosyltransferase involved in cell wall biosynthesis
MSTQPLISCLCVTKQRPEFLEKAIHCFLAQTYGNKELVIVHPEWDRATIDCVDRFGAPELKPYPVERQGLTLGEIRNISIDRACGEYACIWDDDDWHSPDRLTAMHAALVSSRKAAAVLARLLIYDARREQAFLGYERLWENTLVLHRRTANDLGLRYPAKNKSEDYDFVGALIAANLVYPVYDPTLYIYHVTGSNTCDAPHFAAMLKRSTALSSEQSALVKRSMEFSINPQVAHLEMQTEWFKAPIPYIRHSAVPRP